MTALKRVRCDHCGDMTREPISVVGGDGQYTLCAPCAAAARRDFATRVDEDDAAQGEGSDLWHKPRGTKVGA